MSFNPYDLWPSLNEPTGVGRYRIALSGGVDSTVLLHALVELRETGRLRAPVEAMHVHHGLSPNADGWSRHCRGCCESLDVPYHEERVTVDRPFRDGLEAAARRARYAALESAMTPDTCLLLAHHADDQAETLLLQLLRGAGPRGLAAMPRERPFGGGRLLRPLLQFSRAELAAWAESRRLAWMEDESNRELERDRNFLRLEIIPRLKRRWPSLAHTVSRSARLCAEVSQLVRDQAEADRAATRADTSRRLRWTAATELSFPRRKNLLRHWIEENDLPLPNANRLEQMTRDLWEAGEDRQPRIRWPGAEVRRYRDTLYIGEPLPQWSPPERVAWDGRSSIDLGAAGRLEVSPAADPGLRVCLRGRIEIRFRHEGVKCRLAGRNGTRVLKKVLQELGVEPWLRDRIPLIYCDDRLAAIADRAVCEGFRCRPGAQGVVLRWRSRANG